MQWKPFAQVYESAWRPAYMSAARGHRFDSAAEIEWIVAELAGAHGRLIMDLSCGPGVVGRELVRTDVFDRVFGLDFSPAMLRQCRRHCAREGIRDFALVRGDAGQLPLASASVDGVHAGAALHLWPSVPDALREIARVLRPGGRLVASTFIHAQGWRGHATRAFTRAMDITFFRPGALAQACEQAGFVDARESISGSAVLLAATAPG
jgi:ubiquinone/menaquinone biosynthesis C-methylase UbiE